MFKFKGNKAKIKTLTVELSHTKKQLCKANKELEVEKAFSSYSWDNYTKCMCKCEELEREINSLKNENKKLELIIKGFKAVEKAHRQYDCKGKEA